MTDLSVLPERSRSPRLTLIFGVTIFLSAGLLFFVQPLFARMVLPVLGGAPAVWTTAMLFFQAVLILGYGYAHVLSRYVPRRAQIATHGAVWFIASIGLPLAVAQGAQIDPDASMTWQTLMLLATGVGLPFFALSANAPLIQHWYSQSDAEDADNPYVLYGASNLGSLLSLLAFPLIAEPLWGISSISAGWSLGFFALGGMLLLSALSVAAPTPTQIHANSEVAALPTTRTVARWVFLAFLPSSLMLAVTSKISTDFGAMPLIWALPLALYLLTFVVTFRIEPLISDSRMRVACIIALSFLIFVFARGFGPGFNLIIALGMIAAFFVTATFAHKMLYDARPPAEHLTLFYLLMSVGGALGGLFNSILAPALFNDLFEGPITLVLMALCLWQTTKPMNARAILLTLIGAGVTFFALRYMGLSAGLKPVPATVMFAFLCYIALVIHARGPALTFFAALVLGATALTQNSGSHLSDRGFFGTHKVADVNGLRLYANGTTLHGSQRIADLEVERPTPLTYYHPLTPMGQIMTSQTGVTAGTVGVVGLGVGSLACYKQPGQSWHLYEIDPLVDEIARDANQFTFLSQCAPNTPTHLGDARTVLQTQAGLTFDVLFIDAYSSDAVPMHLTTLEAMELYLERLSDSGVLVMHISNRYFRLEHPIGRIAQELGLHTRIQNYGGSGIAENGDRGSKVLVLARSETALGSLVQDPAWQTLETPDFPLWTDDRANPLSALAILNN